MSSTHPAPAAPPAGGVQPAPAARIAPGAVSGDQAAPSVLASLAATAESSAARESFNCLVVGVGGQGAVLASRLVAAASMARGSFVRTAETIGMSQRGGSVVSHVRVASSAAGLPSSLIPLRGAQLVLAFEPGEALRAYDRLCATGSVVCATRPVVPSAAANSGYTGEAQVAWLREHVAPGRFAAVDTDVLERESLSPKCANVLLLGAAVGLGALPFDAEELRGAMRALMKPKLLEMNYRALELGLASTHR